MDVTRHAGPANLRRPTRRLAMLAPATILTALSPSGGRLGTAARTASQNKSARTQQTLTRGQNSAPGRLAALETCSICGCEPRRHHWAAMVCWAPRRRGGKGDRERDGVSKEGEHAHESARERGAAASAFGMMCGPAGLTRAYRTSVILFCCYPLSSSVSVSFFIFLC